MDAIEKGGTAMTIKSPSPAIRYLHKHDLIARNMEVIDYGAGNGRNAVWLRDRGVNVYAYDPYNGTDCCGWAGVSLTPPTGRNHSEVLFTSFVLNILTVDDELEMLQTVHKLTPVQYHIVRNEDLLNHSVCAGQGARTIAEHGFKTSRGYQRLTNVDHAGIICIRDVHGYRIFEGQLYCP
jgi:hypothetical protein